jgi:hypothetical protein
VGKMGILEKIIFPYEKHFRAVNTHVLTPTPLSGNVEKDSKMIYTALQKGNAFIGYDLPAPTNGFRFLAHCAGGTSIMGDTISAAESATLQINLPEPCECHLLKDGEILRSGYKRDNLIHKVQEPGVYRVEAYKKFKGKRRNWILSNPIYIR